MIKKQSIHKIEKYYITFHKRAFLNKNMICIKMFLFLFKKMLFFKIQHLHHALKSI